MKILSLGYPSTYLIQWLRWMGEDVHNTEAKLSLEEVKAIKPDMIFSYGYRHAVSKEILELPPLGAINLHKSLLPYGRGADSNPWSLLEDTPKGVTLHVMDQHIDTGPIIAQEVCPISEEMTLSEAWNFLHAKQEALFIRMWPVVRTGNYPTIPQCGMATRHYVKERYLFMPALGVEGWDVKISDFKKRYKEIYQEAVPR